MSTRSYRARTAMRVARLAQRIHPEPLVVMVSRDSVTVIPGGYQINIPGTDTPLARITHGSVVDQREPKR